MTTRHLLDRHHSIYGIFTDLTQVREFSARLLELGLEQMPVRVLIGEDGTRELDQDGRHHGLLARWRRLLQCLTEERGHLEEYAWALSRGRVVVGVQLPARFDRTPVCTAFTGSGARYVHFYGAWMVQTLSA